MFADSFTMVTNCLIVTIEPLLENLLLEEAEWGLLGSGGLLGGSLGGGTGLLGPLGNVLGSRPVILGLGHGVSLVYVLGPRFVGVSSTLDVPVSVINEDSGLLYVLLVVVSLLLGLSLTKLVVLLLGESSRYVRLSGNLGNLYILLGAGTVIVLVGVRGEKVHSENTVEEGGLLGVYLSGNTGSLVGRGEGRGGGNAPGDDKSRGLHGCI